jgi:hypothetical protein
VALVARFAQARRDLLATVSGFPEEQSEEPVCDEWNIKCVFAHIAGWDTYFTTIVRLLRIGEDVPYRGDNIEKWNVAFVREREGITCNEVLKEFVRASEEFLEEYSHLEEEPWSQRFWDQRDPTPAWVLKHNTEHYGEPLDEIRKRIREWEGQSPWQVRLKYR